MAIGYRQSPQIFSPFLSILAAPQLRTLTILPQIPNLAHLDFSSFLTLLIGRIIIGTILNAMFHYS